MLDQPEVTAKSIETFRGLWGIVGFLLVTWAFLLFAFTDLYSWLAYLEVLLGGWGLATIALVWTTPRYDQRFLNRWTWGSAILMMVGFVAWAWMQIRLSPGYGTDEIAFNQYAAQIAAHWHNPYIHSMGPSFQLFHVSPNGYTFRLNGTPVEALSYPALSFLIYLPLLWLGITSQMAVLVNIFLWVTAVLLTFYLLPKRLRALALIAGSLPILTGFTVGGVTDVVFLIPLLFVAYQWDRYPSFTGRRAWLVPVAMGLVISVKQTPWPIIPFLLAAFYLELKQQGKVKEATRLIIRFSVIMGGTFLLINLPFIVSNPVAWLQGIATPVASNAVPAGEGLVALSVFLGIGGGNLLYFAVLLVTAFVGFFLIYIVTYPRFKSLTFITPSFLLFFSARSFASYFVVLALPALVALCSTTSVTQAEFPRLTTRKRVRNGVLALAVVGLISGTLALTSNSPLTLQILSIRTTGQLATIISVRLNVFNRSDHAVIPHFSAQNGGAETAFWIRSSGPESLPAHTGAYYTIMAPNFFAQTPLTGGFQVAAFAENPGSISISAPFSVNPYHIIINPEAINAVQPLGKVITLTAHLVDAFDKPVHQSGLSVYLGQTVYSQAGQLYGQATINGKGVGMTPVPAHTNTEGVATFYVSSQVASTDPIYFEANLVNQLTGYPYGYSEIVPIRFMNVPK
jgi:uncharacterized membrane protein